MASSKLSVCLISLFVACVKCAKLFATQESVAKSSHEPRYASTSALSGWGLLKLFCPGVAWIVIAIIPFSFGNFALIERPFMKFSDSLRQKKAQPAKHSPA